MRYAQIRPLDVSDGDGIGAALYTQGCPFHCKGCYNEETWDFEGGKEWNPKAEERMLNYIRKPYIVRLSLLGGEPLLPCNVKEIRHLMKKAYEIKPDLQVWAWTGDLVEHKWKIAEDNEDLAWILEHLYRLVDGPFVLSKKDVSLKYRGSTNQRVLTHEDIMKAKEQV